MDLQQKKNIVIIGGGIIGSTTAYYLTRHPKFNPSLHTITLLEATSIAAAASGKAGGLLALWAYPECLVPLSYRLHSELAEQHGGAEKWGYRRLGCGTIAAVVKKNHLTKQDETIEAETIQPSLNYQEASDGVDTVSTALPPTTISPLVPVVNPATTIHVQEENGQVEVGEDIKVDIINATTERDHKDWEKLPKQDTAATSLLADSPLPADLDWIDRSLVQQYEEMGRRGFTETAQVHPFHFTTAIAELARSAGVDIRLGAKVTNIHSSSDDDGFKTVEYEDRQNGDSVMSITGVTDVIVSAGPWTGKLMPRSKVEGLRAHSIVYDADVSPYAVFTDIQLPGDYVPEHRRRLGQKRRHRGNVDPEVYARPFGEVYACGEPDKSIPLPETADQVQTDEAQCDDLAAYIATISPTLASAPIRTKQACYLPQHVRFGTERGPLIGPTSTPGVWIAAGHTCWGIQNGPATGYLMAEWIFDGEAKAADVDVLHPAKFKV